MGHIRFQKAKNGRFINLYLDIVMRGVHGMGLDLGWRKIVD